MRPGRRDTRCVLIGGRYIFKLYFRLAGAGRLHALTRVWANSRTLVAYWAMRSEFDRRAVPPFEKVGAIWAGATEARNLVD